MSIQPHPVQSLADPQARWSEDRCLLVRSLVSPSKIDRLLAEFSESVKTSGKEMPRQASFRRETGPRSYPHDYLSQSSLTPEGYMREGLKNPHVMWGVAPAFSGMVLDILCSPDVQDALATLEPDYPDYTLHQSMLFDFNPGTEPHQDSYYIDSEPRGFVVGFWLALEDIHDSAGRFYVMPGSQLDGPKPELFTAETNKDYLDLLDAYFKGQQAKLFAPELKKGDALFWGGQIVHGSLANTDPRRSRKSLTAHYVPRPLLGRNNARVFANTIEQTAHGMPYVVTNRPDADGRQIVQEALREVDIGQGQPLTFRVSRTADGEQTAVRTR
jgi:phytanoyl-CoA hydroxylase